MAFRVGQKVVCVDDTGPGCWSPESEISAGHIYTVRSLGIAASGSPGIRLEETILRGGVGHVTGGPFFDACYRAERFRPVVEKKTDISIFTAMLTPSPERVS